MILRARTWIKGRKGLPINAFLPKCLWSRMLIRKRSSTRPYSSTKGQPQREKFHHRRRVFYTQPCGFKLGLSRLPHFGRHLAPGPHEVATNQEVIFPHPHANISSLPADWHLASVFHLPAGYQDDGHQELAEPIPLSMASPCPRPPLPLPLRTRSSSSSLSSAKTAPSA